MEQNFIDTISPDLDELTQIYRRDTVTKYVLKLVENKIYFSYAILDVDNFKLINDNYGYSVGDKVLKEVAKSLKELLKGKGIVGRYGGDEFIIVLPNIKEYDELWSNLFEIIRSPYKLKFTVENNISITYSVGCSRFFIDTTNLDELFTLADKALYRAKIKGRNCFVIYLKEKHKNIILKAFREKTYSQINLHAICYNLLSDSSSNLEDNFRRTINFVASYLMLDHLCLQLDGNILYEYIQPISKTKKFTPYKDDYIKEFLSEQGVFYENTVISSNHIDSNLYSDFMMQNVYASYISKLKVCDQEFGYLRADMTTVDTGRIWQNEDLVLLYSISNTIAMLLYIDKLKKTTKI